MNAPVLYITYDGLLEPLGQSQVLAYLERLAADREVHLLSFEKPADWRDRAAREALAARVRAAGIRWRPLRYHKRLSVLATAWDAARGIAFGLWLIPRARIGIVHARSYVPAVMALTLKRLTGARFVFDMRGFWVDERVDGGLWPRDGLLYRIGKWFERRFLLAADHVVSLTQAAVRQMERFDYLRGRMPAVTVIPTCADLNRFRPSSPPETDFVLGYVGSAGTWYRFDAVVASFAALRSRLPRARLLILNRNEHDYIRRCLSEGGIPDTAVELREASPAQVPQQMARMHAGIFFIKPVFSKQASAPTKLGEFLGCGVPCLTNAGVGDLTDILHGEKAGVAVTDLEPDALREGIDALLELLRDPAIRARCVEAARRHYSLDEGVARYRAVYRGVEGHQACDC